MKQDELLQALSEAELALEEYVEKHRHELD
jgi:hypothetical protein